MKRTNDLRKNFIWNLIGLSFYGFISLFLLIIVKRINGLDISGIFSYAYSICTLFFYISLYYSRTYQIANTKINIEPIIHQNEVLTLKLFFLTD